MKIQHCFSLAFALGFAAFAAQVSATVVSEDFSANAAGTYGTTTGYHTGLTVQAANLANGWNVTSANVDVVVAGSDTYVDLEGGSCPSGNGCYPGDGNYLGSAFGTITYNTVTLSAGDYSWSFTYGDGATGADQNLLDFGIAGLSNYVTQQINTTAAIAAASTSTLTVSGVFTLSAAQALTVSFAQSEAYDNAVADNQGTNLYQFSLAAVPVPEPSTLALLAFGLLGVGARKRKTR